MAAGGLDLETKFKKCTDFVRALPKDGPIKPSDETKLRFYSHFKQATVGACQEPQSGFLDFVGKSKHNAWSGLGAMTKEAAMQGYINALREVLDQNQKSPESE
uniref:acyl-CoA-binding domain-containing protein n=1 Tax=Salmonella sp. s51228 TaxID=3159652 RepID=UPI00397F4E77